MFTSNNISASNRVAVRHSQSSLHFGVKRKYEEAASSLSSTQLLQRQKETNDAFITWRTAVDEAGERPPATEKSKLVNLHRTFLLLVESALQPLGASYRRVNAHDNFVPLSPDIKEGKARKNQGEFGFKYKGVQYKASDSDSKDIISVNDMAKATVRGQQFQNRGYSSRFQNNDYETGLASQASDPVFAYLASKVSKEEEAPPACTASRSPQLNPCQHFHSIVCYY